MSECMSFLRNHQSKLLVYIHGLLVTIMVTTLVIFNSKSTLSVITALHNHLKKKTIIMLLCISGSIIMFIVSSSPQW